MRSLSLIFCPFILFFISESLPDGTCAENYHCLNINTTCIKRRCMCGEGLFANETICSERMYIVCYFLYNFLTVVCLADKRNQLLWNEIFFFISQILVKYFLFLFYLIISERNLGQTCVLNRECAGRNTMCLYNLCTCAFGFMVVNGTNSCSGEFYLFFF